MARCRGRPSEHCRAAPKWPGAGSIPARAGCLRSISRAVATSSSRSAPRNTVCATEDGGLSDEKLREIAAHDQVKMFEIKLSQGAKPGKGGILPAEKVTAEIAQIRGIPRRPGVDLAEPASGDRRTTRRFSILSHMCARSAASRPASSASSAPMAGLNRCARRSTGAASEHAPDFISIDSGDGGTGAAPMPLMDNVGLPIRQSLPMVAEYPAALRPAETGSK